MTFFLPQHRLLVRGYNSQKFLRTIAEHVTAFISLQSYKGLSKQLRNWDHLCKGVHFDWSYRSDRNVPFHLTKFCPPALLLYCIQLTRTISKRAVSWVRSVQPECTVPLSARNFRNLSNCTRCITTITIMRQWKSTLIWTPYLVLRTVDFVPGKRKPFHFFSTDIPLIRTDTFYGPLSVYINGV